MKLLLFSEKFEISIINIEINKTEVRAHLDTGILIISEEVFKKLSIPLHAWNKEGLKWMKYISSNHSKT